MFKSLTKIALLSGVAMVGTSYFMATANAEPKFMFRYASSAGGGTSNGGSTGGGTTEPEIPEEPEPETPVEPIKLQFLSEDNFSHVDSNLNGLVDENEEVYHTVFVRNNGDRIVSNLNSKILSNIFMQSYGQSTYEEGTDRFYNCQNTSLNPSQETACTTIIRANHNILVPDPMSQYPQWNVNSYIIDDEMNSADGSLIDSKTSIYNLPIEDFGIYNQRDHVAVDNFRYEFNDINGDGYLASDDELIFNFDIINIHPLVDDSNLSNDVRFNLVINNTNVSKSTTIGKLNKDWGAQSVEIRYKASEFSSFKGETITPKFEIQVNNLDKYFWPGHQLIFDVPNL